MQRRPLGQSGLSVSPIALGCAGMGGDDEWGPVDDNESIATIHSAIELGINLIDTAPTYGKGHAEEIVGNAVQSYRDEVLVATQCGLVGGADEGETRRCLTAGSIQRECERSLRRLRVECIDLYQCHWPDPATPIEETLGAMSRLVEQGKVRVVGLCNYGCQRLAEARAVGTFHAVQLQLSLLKRQATEELIPYCQEYQIGVLAYGALGQGLLSGALRSDARFTDARRHDPEFQGRRYASNLELVEKVRRVAENHEKSVGQLALNWVCDFAGVTAVIVGATRPSQILENVGAIGWRPDGDEQGIIDAVLSERD